VASGRVLSGCRHGQPDEDAERPHKREVRAAVEACSRGGREQRGERLLAVRAAAADGQVGAVDGLSAARAEGELVPSPESDTSNGTLHDLAVKQRA